MIGPTSGRDEGQRQNGAELESSGAGGQGRPWHKSQGAIELPATGVLSQRDLTLRGSGSSLICEVQNTTLPVPQRWKDSL